MYPACFKFKATHPEQVSSVRSTSRICMLSRVVLLLVIYSNLSNLRRVPSKLLKMALNISIRSLILTLLLKALYHSSSILWLYVFYKSQGHSITIWPFRLSRRLLTSSETGSRLKDSYFNAIVRVLLSLLWTTPTKQSPSTEKYKRLKIWLTLATSSELHLAKLLRKKFRAAKELEFFKKYLRNLTKRLQECRLWRSKWAKTRTWSNVIFSKKWRC